MALARCNDAAAAGSNPLAATLLYQALDTSDVPGGVVNIITGPRASLMETLAGHDDVEGVWAINSPAEVVKKIEALSVGNMKRVWTPKDSLPALSEALREATQVKNVWIPYTDELPW